MSDEVEDQARRGGARDRGDDHEGGGQEAQPDREADVPADGLEARGDLGPAEPTFSKLEVIAEPACLTRPGRRAGSSPPPPRPRRPPGPPTPGSRPRRPARASSSSSSRSSSSVSSSSRSSSSSSSSSRLLLVAAPRLLERRSVIRALSSRRAPRRRPRGSRRRARTPASRPARWPARRPGRCPPSASGLTPRHPREAPDEALERLPVAAQRVDRDPLTRARGARRRSGRTRPPGPPRRGRRPRRRRRRGRRSSPARDGAARPPRRGPATKGSPARPPRAGAGRWRARWVSGRPLTCSRISSGS